MRRAPVPWPSVAGALAAALALGGCVILFDYDEYGDAGAGAGANADAGADAGAGGQGGVAESCDPGTTAPCYTGEPSTTEDVGVCVGGTRTCRPDGQGYGACAGEVTPVVEVCANRADEDCNGALCAEPRWSQRYGDNREQALAGLTIDGADSILLTGWFKGDLELAPLPAITRDPASGPDLFVAKLSSDGAPLWLMGGGDAAAPAQRGQGVATDLLGGNVFVTGYREAVNADPEAGFLLKFSGNGVPSTPVTFSGSGHTRGLAVAADIGVSLYVVGRYQGTIQLNVAHTSSPPERSDVLIIQLFSHPTMGWSRSFGGSADDEALGVTVDPSNQVLVTGRYRRVMAFDDTKEPLVDDLPDAGAASDAFVMKLGPDGKVRWARGLVDSTDAADAAGRAIAAGPDGSLVVAGSMSGTTRFGGDSSVPLESGGGVDAFVARYNTDGELLWAKALGGPGEEHATGLSVDWNGNVFVSGTFTGTIDLEPGAPGGELTSAGDQDLFLAKLSAEGAYLWSARFASAGASAPGGDPRLIRVAAPTGEAFLAGSWDSELGFGAETGPLSPLGDLDVFLARFGL